MKVTSPNSPAASAAHALARKPLNRAKAIRESCVECMGYQVRGINKCPDLACPLWEWRRGPGGPEPSEVPIRRQRYEADAHGQTP